MKIKLYFLFFFALSFVSKSYCQEKKWTIEACVNYALEHNISIKQTDLNNKTAAIDKSSAIGNFLPTLNASTSHSWNIGLNQNITTGLLENQTTQFTQAGLNANVTIYNGLQNINRLRRANLAILGAQYQLSKMKDDISLNVANAFLQILFNKETLKVQQNQLALTEKQLKRTQDIVDAGALPRGDLLDIQATIASNKQNIIAAENALYLSKISLAQLLQLSDYESFDIADDQYNIPQSATMLLSAKDVFEKAKTNRSEIKIAKNNLDLAEKDVKIARGAFQPTLSGFYSFSTRASSSGRVVDAVPNSSNPTSIIGFVDGTFQNVLQPNYTAILGNPEPIFTQFSNNKGNSFGLQLSIPILNGFSVRNNVARAKINVESQQIALTQAELSLETNIYKAFTDAKGSLNAHQSALVALDARKQAYNYSKEKYEAGLMNSFEVNQAQNLLTNAESEVIRTKYDYIFKVKVVEFYFGIPINKN